jgi:hypothetical protein
MSGSAVGFALVDRLQENGEALDHDAFEVSSHNDYAAHVADSALGMARIAAASGHHLEAIRLTWTEDVRGHAMRVMAALRATAQAPVETVELLAASEAVARSIASDRIAVCVLARDTAVALMIGEDTTIRGHRGNAVTRWLTREIEQGPWRPERLLVVCSDRELRDLAEQLANDLAIPSVGIRQAHVVLAIAAASGQDAARTIARTLPLSPRRRATVLASAAAVVLAVSVVSGSELRFDSPRPAATAAPAASPTAAPPAAVAEAVVNHSLVPVPEGLPIVPPPAVQREVVPEAVVGDEPQTPVTAEAPAQVHDIAPVRQSPAAPAEQHLQSPTIRPPGEAIGPSDVSTALPAQIAPVQAPAAQVPPAQPPVVQPPLIQLPVIQFGPAQPAPFQAPPVQSPPAQLPAVQGPPAEVPPQHVSPDADPATCVLFCGFAL